MTSKIFFKTAANAIPLSNPNEIRAKQKVKRAKKGAARTCKTQPKCGLRFL